MTMTRIENITISSADARALVDWLAERPEIEKDAESDPRIGVAGADVRLGLIAAGPAPLGVDLLVYAAVAVTVISGADYFLGLRKRIADAWQLVESMRLMRSVSPVEFIAVPSPACWIESERGV